MSKTNKELAVDVAKGLDKGRYGDSEGDPRPDIIKGSDHMKTFEDYKRAIENAGPVLVGLLSLLSFFLAPPPPIW